MELWQEILIILASIAVGLAAGVLLSYAVLWLTRKRQEASFGDLVSGFKGMSKVPEATVIPAGAGGGDDLYQGRVALEITEPISFADIAKLKAHLYEVPDLQLVSIGGSSVGQTMIIVTADKPLPLLSILSEIPMAKGVSKKENNIQMALRTTQPA